jgi:hypothetical protein
VDVNRAPREALLRVPGLGCARWARCFCPATAAVAAGRRGPAHHLAGQCGRSSSRPIGGRRCWSIGPTCAANGPAQGAATRTVRGLITRARRLPAPDDSEAWRSAARALVLAGIEPDAVAWEEPGRAPATCSRRTPRRCHTAPRRRIGAGQQAVPRSGAHGLNRAPERFVWPIACSGACRASRGRRRMRPIRWCGGWTSFPARCGGTFTRCALSCARRGRS